MSRFLLSDRPVKGLGLRVAFTVKVRIGFRLGLGV